MSTKAGQLQYGKFKCTHSDLNHTIGRTPTRKQSQTLELQHTYRCFFAVGFRHDWEKQLRVVLKERVFPEHHLSYVDGEEPHSYSDQIGRAVRGLMESADFFVAEISDLNPNVCFEMGSGIALGRWFKRLRNVEHRCDIDDDRIERVLHSLRYQEYSFATNTPGHNSGNSDVQSVNHAIAKVVAEFEVFHKRAEPFYNPFDQKVRLNVMRPQERGRPSVVLFAEAPAPFASWIVDFKAEIRRELEHRPYDDPGTAYDGPEALKYLEAIARSAKCVIDITKDSRFACFLLGYATGRQRHVLAVRHKEKQPVIASFRGEAAIFEYESRDDLWHEVKKFLQDAGVGRNA